MVHYFNTSLSVESLEKSAANVRLRPSGEAGVNIWYTKTNQTSGLKSIELLQRSLEVPKEGEIRAPNTTGINGTDL